MDDSLQKPSMVLGGRQLQYSVIPASYDVMMLGISIATKRRDEHYYSERAVFKMKIIRVS